MAFNPNALSDAEYWAIANGGAGFQPQPQTLLSPLQILGGYLANGGFNFADLQQREVDAVANYLAAYPGRIRITEPWQYYTPPVAQQPANLPYPMYEEDPWSRVAQIRGQMSPSYAYNAYPYYPV